MANPAFGQGLFTAAQQIGAIPAQRRQLEQAQAEKAKLERQRQYQAGLLSLGASGDLAPLAHLSLPLIGDGEVWYKGSIKKAKDILVKYNWNPIQLKSKEGLALLNGTQFFKNMHIFFQFTYDLFILLHILLKF